MKDRASAKPIRSDRLHVRQLARMHAGNAGRALRTLLRERRYDEPLRVGELKEIVEEIVDALGYAIDAIEALDK